MSVYRLERVELQDAERVAPLFDQYRVYYGQQSDVQAALDFVRARLEAEESVIFAAATGEGAERVYGGFTQLYPSFSSVTAQRLWILNDLFVAADVRGHGIGSMLLEGAEAFAAATGTKGLTLTTMTDNYTAQRLYEAKGYVRDDEFYTYNLFFKKG